MIITPAKGINLKDYPNSILDGKVWRMTEKIDGVRRLFPKLSNGSVKCFSRTNKPDIWLPHITEFFEAPWFPADMVYDCELVDRKLYFEKVDSFLLRSESSAKASQQFFDNKKDLMAVCFDMFCPYGDTRVGRERHIELSKIFANGTLKDAVTMVPYFGNIYGADMDTIASVMKEVARHNGEGIMLMDMDSIYIPGESDSLVKVKKLKEFIGKIVDVEMARKGTKIEGGVAAMICSVKGCTVPVRVGSGLNNEQRRFLAENSPIGKEIEIEAFSYSRDKSGNISLNLPIFKRIIDNNKE